jgi:hypothetical protein
MKPFIYFLSLTVLSSVTINPIGFDDLFSGDSDPFADFNFGGMDNFFNDSSFDDADPFEALFNQNATASPSYFSDEPTTQAKKEITPPVAQTLEEAFKNSIDAKVTKLTPQYKKALTEYISPVISELQILSNNCASLALGIKLQTELTPYTTRILESLELVTKLKHNSVYHITFLTKEFSATREKIMKAARDLQLINNDFTALPTDKSDLGKAPAEKIQLAQKKLFKKIETATTKLLQPITTELTKLFTHKQAETAIKAKQKKHSASIKGSSASASGGWSNTANSYFNDDFNFGGYGGGNSGWGDDAGFWNSFDGSGFGSSYGWNDSFGGGYGDSWNNSSSSDSWGSSYGSFKGNNSTTSSSPQSSQRLDSARYNSSSVDDFNFDSPKEKSSHIGGYTPPAETDINELSPLDQIKKLIPLMSTRMKTWTPGQNKNEIKKLLEKSSFAGDIERLTRLFTLVAENKTEMSSELLKKYSDFKDLLEKSIGICVDAATYASPPFAELFEENAQSKNKNISLQDVRNALASAKRQREYAYQKLLQLLGVIRLHEADSSLYQAILGKLQRHAYMTLRQIAEFFEKEKKKELFSLDQLMQLTGLSRKLFHEPIVIGYAVLKNIPSGDDDKEKKSATPTTHDIVHALKEKQQEIASYVVPLVQKNYTVFNAAITIMQDAVAAVRDDLKLAEDEEFIPNHISAIQALAAKIDRILSSEPYSSHEYANEIRKLLLPYDKKQYQHIEIQHALLAELNQCWNEKTLDGQSMQEEDADDEADESDSQQEETEDHPLPQSTPVIMQNTPINTQSKPILLDDSTEQQPFDEEAAMNDSFALDDE